MDANFSDISSMPLPMSSPTPTKNSLARSANVANDADSSANSSAKITAQNASASVESSASAKVTGGETRSSASANAPENSTATAVAVSRDQASATISITMPLKTLARIASENPAIFSQARITFVDGKAVIEFANDEQAEKFQATLSSSSKNENLQTASSAERDISLLLSLKRAADSAGEKSGELSASSRELLAPRNQTSASPVQNSVSALSANLPPNFKINEFLLSSQMEIAGQKFPLPPLIFSPANFAEVAKLFASASVAANGYIEFPLADFSMPANSASSTAQTVSPFADLPRLQLSIPPALSAALFAVKENLSPEIFRAPNGQTNDSQSASGEKSGGAATNFLTQNDRENLAVRWLLPENVTVRGEWRAENKPAIFNDATQINSSADRQIMLAGLTPGAATRAAAAALIGEGLAIERGNIQVLFAAAAGRSDEDRGPILRAAAHLLKINAPVSVAIAAGQAWNETANAITTKLATATDYLDELIGTKTGEENSSLELPNENSAAGEKTVSAEAKKFLATALTELRNLPLPTDNADLPEKLQKFFASFAREKLGNAAALIEQATADILGKHPNLPRLDAALTAVLAKLNIEQSNKIDEADKGVDVPAAENTRQKESFFPAKFLAGGEKFDLAELAKRFSSANLSSPSSPIFSPRLPHPGIEKFPSEWQDVASDFSAKIDLPKIENALREIFADDLPLSDVASRAENAAKNMERSTLRELAATLQSLEHDEIAAEPALKKLADTAGEIRDLGRIFTAMKMENLATEPQNPALISATIPFAMNGNGAGEGKLKMFYHRGGGKNKWSSRVVLDLDMSALGDVVGDLRFLPDKNLSLVIGVRDETVRQKITDDRETLIAGLAQLGFFCHPDFRLVDAPPITETVKEIHPENSAENNFGFNKNGRIDVKV